MQTIATKLSRLAPAAAALSAQQRRHLIHGCGGSPRRANRALRHGFAELLIDAYSSALDAGLAHVQAVQKCDALWLDLVPRQADAEPADESEAEIELRAAAAGRPTALPMTQAEAQAELAAREAVAERVEPAPAAIAAIVAAVAPKAPKGPKGSRKSAPRFMGKRPSLLPTAAEAAAILASTQPAA